jgi:hypothetical protein
MVVKRPKLSLAEQFYLPAIVTGLAITLKHLRKLLSGKTKATMQYPEQRWDSQLPPWYRGAPALVKDGRSMPGDRRALAVTAFIQHITVSVRADDGARVLAQDPSATLRGLLSRLVEVASEVGQASSQGNIALVLFDKARIGRIGGVSIASGGYPDGIPDKLVDAN